MAAASGDSAPWRAWRTSLRAAVSAAASAASFSLRSFSVMTSQLAMAPMWLPSLSRIADTSRSRVSGPTWMLARRGRLLSEPRMPRW